MLVSDASDRRLPGSTRPSGSKGRRVAFSSDEPVRLPEHHARIRKAGPRGGASLSRSDLMFVGIDVSKDRLDVHVNPGGVAWSVANDDDGHRGLASRLAELKPTLVVTEATG